MRSTDVKDIENGFQPNPNLNSIYKCYKIVPKNEVTQIYDIINKVEYNGHVGDILEEDGHKILIQIHNLLHEDAQKLHMDYATDNGIYAKWVRKSEVKISTYRIDL